MLMDVGFETKEILNQDHRIEISATQQNGEGLWLIFTGIKNEDEKASIFEVGRGSNPNFNNRVCPVPGADAWEVFILL